MTSRPQTPGRKPHLLLVDDDEAAAFFVRRAIRKAGEDVHFSYVTGVQAALETLRRPADEHGPVTHILLDLNMPGLTGWDFLEMTRNDEELLPPHVRVFVLTSSVNPDDITRAEAYDRVAAYFEKNPNAHMVKSVLGLAA